jgi:hypothetical protein
MQAGEGEQALAGLFQAVRDGMAFQPPFGQEQPTPAHHLGAGLGIDHVVIVGGDFFVQRLWCMREQIAMLMHGAALGRQLRPKGGKRAFEAGAAIDQQEFWRSQATRDQIVEHGTPGGFALAAHVPDRQQHLLPVTADAEHDQQRNIGRTAVQPNLYHRAVEDQVNEALPSQAAPVPVPPVRLDLAPSAADHVLAHGAFEQSAERASPAACWCRQGRLRQSAPPPAGSSARGAAGWRCAIPSSHLRALPSEPAAP